jgi:small subunit ribosomal protein S16
LYKKHLLGGVAKGAFTEAEAEAKFNAWASEKQSKIDAKSNKLASDATAAKKAQLAAETKVKEDRAAALAAKAAEAAAAAVEETAEATEEVAAE